MVDVPVIAAARLESDVCEEDGTLPWFCQRVQIRIAGKILCKSGIFFALAKYVRLVKCCFIFDFHDKCLLY